MKVANAKWFGGETFSQVKREGKMFPRGTEVASHCHHWLRYIVSWLFVSTRELLVINSMRS